eukprot:9486857-Pyramimonas_sp.AAC.1
MEKALLQTAIFIPGTVPAFVNTLGESNSTVVEWSLGGSKLTAGCAGDAGKAGLGKAGLSWEAPQPMGTSSARAPSISSLLSPPCG